MAEMSGQGGQLRPEDEWMDQAVESFVSTAPYPPTGPPPGPAPELPAGVTSATPFARLGAWALEIVLFIVTLGIGWLVWGYAVGSIGQTPAKRLMKLRVIRHSDGMPSKISRMFWMRGIVGSLLVPIAVVLTLGIILFMPFWDPLNRNLWDRISRSRVVQDPDNSWNTEPSFIGTWTGPRRPPLPY